jgi:hypothetical protein
MIISDQVEVDDQAAVVLVPASTARGRRVYLRSTSGDDPVYLGPAGVTDATGAALLDTDQWTPFEIHESDALYGICGSSGSATVHVLIT